MVIQNYRGNSEKIFAIEELECSYNCFYKLLCVQKTRCIVAGGFEVKFNIIQIFWMVYAPNIWGKGVQTPGSIEHIHKHILNPEM